MKYESVIPTKAREEIISMLSSILSNSMILYVKTRKFHWDVTDEGFKDLHGVFQSQYLKLKASIDELAVKIKNVESYEQRGQASRRSSSREESQHRSTRDMITELLADHEAVIVQIGKDIDSCMERYKDNETAGFLVKLLDEHKQIARVLNTELN